MLNHSAEPEDGQQSGIDCVLCGNKMDFCIYPVRYFCCLECKDDATQAIQSNLHPSHVASLIIARKINRYISLEYGLEMLRSKDKLSRTRLIEILWLQKTVEDLASRIGSIDGLKKLIEEIGRGPFPK